MGLAALAALLIAVVVWIVLRVRQGSPEKREQRRRAFLNRTGRLGDAFITDTTDSVIFYEYSVHGVQYTASQDVSAVLNRLPAPVERLIGVAHLKYATNNPANSILICEEWSGLRVPSRAVSQ